MNSTGGNITVANVDAVTDDLTTLILNAGTGNVQAGSIGTATTNEFNLVSITGTTLTLLGPIIANTVILNGGTGVTYLSANITTNNTPITFTQPVIRNGVNNVTVSTGSTGANITFDSTIDGDTPGIRNLTLAAGVGTVTLDGAVGATTTLNNFTITGATIIQGSTVNTTGAVSYTRYERHRPRRQHHHRWWRGNDDRPDDADRKHSHRHHECRWNCRRSEHRLQQHDQRRQDPHTHRRYRRHGFIWRGGRHHPSHQLNRHRRHDYTEL